ncbi:UilS family quorum-quenching N-acyl-homoserine lactonase [Francisella sp. SYW-2]|uniref:UilS family quorum-quenching N-acyl-homoserine lactonase n=1 Tax=Francisella sp. SYW-2 TaxID=2610886 RepID=UPI00123D2BD7|nr:alpha/beta fold hydrolase [Francisella sp. SYW-2]
MEKVNFTSHGCNISAQLLYKPENFDQNNKYPAIILCHGFAGFKEVLLPAYAEAFAMAGYVVLNFDYRGFGESEGERGRLVPKLQIEDIHSAIDYVAGLDFVDSNKIGLWGTSYGGANAITAAAQNDLVKCLSVQLTFANGERVITGDMSDEEKEKFLGMIEKMLAKKEKTGKEMMVPLHKVLTDEQSKGFYERYSKEYDAFDIKIPFLTVNETMSHKPENYIGDLRIPVLIVASDTDSVNPVEESHILYEKANEPKELMILEGISHYECYEGEPLQKILAKQIAWFDEYIK